MKGLFFFMLAISSSLFLGFMNNHTAYNSNEVNEECVEVLETTLDEYWYQGKAEISRFELQQSRYGEVHQGDAVMIFVTEDFRTDIQVKLEMKPIKTKPSIL